MGSDMTKVIAGTTRTQPRAVEEKRATRKRTRESEGD